MRPLLPLPSPTHKTSVCRFPAPLPLPCPQRGLKDVLGSSRLRHRLVLLGGAWFAAAAGYYGLALLADGISSGRIGSDDSVYVTLLSAFAYEIPAIAAAGLAVERAGRKATGIAAFMQGGWVGGLCTIQLASQPLWPAPVCMDLLPCTPIVLIKC